MLTTSRSHSVGSILLSALALATSVTSSVVPADAYNRARDASCTTQYGRISVVDPTGSRSPELFDSASTTLDASQFYLTYDLPSAGIFKYQNCGGVPADLECINYQGPNADDRMLGVSGGINQKNYYYYTTAINHIGGVGGSTEEIPAFVGVFDTGDYTSQSAVWTVDDSDGSLTATLTDVNGNAGSPLIPCFASPLAGDEIQLLLSGSQSLENCPHQRTLSFVPATVGFGQVCYGPGWSDKAPCQQGSCIKPQATYGAPASSSWKCALPLP